VPVTTHSAHPLSADIAGEQRAEPCPPQPHGRTTDVDTALEYQAFDAPQ
jgi:hypothetical protein